MYIILKKQFFGCITILTKDGLYLRMAFIEDSGSLFRQYSSLKCFPHGGSANATEKAHVLLNGWKDFRTLNLRQGCGRGDEGTVKNEGDELSSVYA